MEYTQTSIFPKKEDVLLRLVLKNSMLHHAIQFKKPYMKDAPMPEVGDIKLINIFGKDYTGNVTKVMAETEYDTKKEVKAVYIQVEWDDPIIKKSATAIKKWVQNDGWKARKRAYYFWDDLENKKIMFSGIGVRK